MHQITEIDILLRLMAAMVMGSMIGLNRNLQGKPAGLRTHALVTISTALLVILGIRLEMAFSGPQVAATASFGDANAVSRVIQGILQGIGFLGAGVIMRTESGKRVHGLTTAASVWVSAALGIACGTGYWCIVLTGFFLVFMVLLFGGAVERQLHQRFSFLAHEEDNGN